RDRLAGRGAGVPRAARAQPGVAMMPGAPLIDWRDAVVHTPGGRRLFGPFDWIVAPGEVWCVVGANGAGMSSLAGTVSGLLALRGGRVLFAGRPIGDSDIASLARLRGLLSQSCQAPFGLDALQTLMLACEPRARLCLRDAPADREAALA